MLELHSSSSESPSPGCSSSDHHQQQQQQHSAGHEPVSSVSPVLSMINLNLHDATGKPAFSGIFGQSGLSALHSMSDLKLGPSPPLAADHHHPAYHHTKPSHCAMASSSSPVHSSSSTSHYIHDILNRPATLAANSPTNTFSNALAGSLPKFPLASVPSSVCFSAAAAAAANGLGHKINPLNELQSRHIYWPSMVQNSNLWRERLANAGTDG